MSARSDKAGFIDDQLLWAELERGGRQAADSRLVGEILDKAALARGLTAPEAAVLMQLEDPELKTELYRVAGRVKMEIYGRRIVLFAPLYISDYCVNNCRYCGYQHSSPQPRRKLSLAEIADETLAILAMGHKRIALEQGEDPANNPIDYVVEALETIYAQNYRGSNIR